jgi:hypothetical protein
MNKSKHPKKKEGGIPGTKWKHAHARRQKNHIIG